MGAAEPKKLALLRILQILKEYSDIDRPLTQAVIAEKLKEKYGIEIERKAIAANLSLLKEAGYEIETTRSGCYIVTRDFEKSELRLLIDSVLSSKYISKKHTADLVEKIAKLANKNFYSSTRHIHSVLDWQKNESPELFLNIEVISEAIERKKQISFKYMKYTVDKKLQPEHEYIVSPVQMIMTPQNYYLLAIRESMSSLTKKKEYEARIFKLSYIQDISTEENRNAIDKSQVDVLKDGLDARQLVMEHPSIESYFFNKLENITIVCPSWEIGDVIEAFGTDIKITKLQNLNKKGELFELHDLNVDLSRELLAESAIKISFKATRYAAKSFVLRRYPLVCITKPEELKNNLMEDIRLLYELHAYLPELVEEAEEKEK